MQENYSNWKDTLIFLLIEYKHFNIFHHMREQTFGFYGAWMKFSILFILRKCRSGLSFSFN